MRKVKLFIANSLDGYIARLDGSLDWLFTDDDYGTKNFLESIDTAMMGRKTYDVTLSRGGIPDSPKGIKYYVFSRSSKSNSDKKVQLVSGNVRSFVESLRQAEGKDIWLMGGGELVESFLKEHLIDEILLTVHPVILGAGIPLFRGEHRQTDLKLINCRFYESETLIENAR